MNGMMPLLAAAEALDVIYINVWAILISLANLVILFLILKKLLFKPVVKVVSERERQLAERMRAADEAERQAQEDKAQYAAQLARAGEDAREILKNASATAALTGEEVVRDAKRRAAAIVQKAESDAEREKKKAVNALKDEVAALSVDMAGQIVGREITDKDQRRLIDSFLTDWEAPDA